MDLLSKGGEARDRLGMVERHLEPGACVAVVPRHAEVLEAEPAQHLDGVFRQGSKGIAGMVGSAVGFRRFAMTAQFGATPVKALTKLGAILCQVTWVSGLPSRRRS